jgi:glutamate/tyrosine decarboxylase-like PLP-dependent enzyme
LNVNVDPLLAMPHAAPSHDEMLAASRALTDWALRHHQTLPQQTIGRIADPEAMAARLAEPPPPDGAPFHDILQRFETQIAPYAFRVDHPRFLAFVPGAPSFASLLGDWLTSAANFFGGVWLEAAGPAQVELTVLDWFKAWLGYPADAHGAFTSGGSEANLTALVVARDQVPHAERSRLVLYVGEQRHWSIDRAAMVMGLAPEQVRPLPAGSDLTLRVDALAAAVARDRRAGLRPWAVVATAGATNTGAVDPLDQLADFASRENLWLHIDAAYGWAAILTNEGRVALRGIERADSITLDPHKWFAQTFESGCLLVRDGQRLDATFTMRPDYLQDAEPHAGEVNFSDRGIALTRRFRALKVWVSVQMLGEQWFRGLIERCCRLARFAEEALIAAGKFEILHPPRLSIVCFRLRPPGTSEEELDAVNEQVARRLRESGRAFLSSTKIHGRYALRMCFVNWRTTSGDVLEVIESLRA